MMCIFLRIEQLFCSWDELLTHLIFYLVFHWNLVSNYFYYSITCKSGSSDLKILFYFHNTIFIKNLTGNVVVFHPFHSDFKSRLKQMKMKYYFLCSDVSIQNISFSLSFFTLFFILFKIFHSLFYFIVFLCCFLKNIKLYVKHVAKR